MIIIVIMVGDVKHTILCLASDEAGAGGSRHLGRQAAAIRAELECSRARDRFEVVPQLVSEPLDLLRVLRKLRPTVVCFASDGGHGRAAERRADLAGQAPVRDAGHVGDGFGGLCFRRREGRRRCVSPGSVQETFAAAGRSVRLVMLSGCYVDLQAEALVGHVDCVVGTSGAARPEATRAYAMGFVGALGEYESVAAAHRQARAAILLEGLGSCELSQMQVRRGVDADELVLAALP